ncbi:MAG: ABC transporter permease [Acidobacteriota bacterium]|mgnify:FL=1
MLRDAYFLARKDLGHMFRSRETWLWAFAMPVLFFYFIGAVTGGSSRSRDTREVIALSVPPDAGFLADHLAKRLEERNYRVVRARTPEELARYRRRLAIPAGFTASVLAAKPVKLELGRTGGGMDADYDQVRVARAAYSVLADLIVTSKDGGAPTPEALGKLAQQPRALSLAVAAAGQRKDPPHGFEQSVPGTMVMFILLAMMTSGAVWLVIERNQGLLRRLASTPISRPAIVAGKWGARLALGLIQVAFAMLAGRLLFGVRWGPNWPAILLVAAAYAGLTAALGVLLGSLARSENQAVGIGVVATNVLAALGGCWWPIEIAPAWAQKLALALPTGWAMDALHKLVSFGAAPAAVVPHLAAMAAAALVAGWLAARSFRFQ